jgi:hypothetical protein
MPHRLPVSVSSPAPAVGHGGRRPGWTRRTLTVLLIIDTLLYLGSRDTLSKYYRRVEELLARDF